MSVTAPSCTVLTASSIRAGDNDRKTFDQAALEELARSIQENGIAQVPTVRPLDEGAFEIVCGERRFRAMTEVLGWTDIPVVVRELDDRQASAIMLAENVARADLDPLAEAQAYQKRMDRFGLTAREVADLAGVSLDRVNLRLRLLAIVPEAQHLTSIGQLPISFGPMLAGLDPNRQRLALRAWSDANGSLNWWEWDRLVKRLRAEQDQQGLFDLAAMTTLQIEEYVVDAKKGTTPAKALRSLVAELAAALEQAGGDAELVARARSAA